MTTMRRLGQSDQDGAGAAEGGRAADHAGPGMASPGRPRTSEADPWNAVLEGGRHLDLAEYPGALLLRVANVIHQDGTAVYAKKHGLTVPEWRLLGRLHESAPIQLSTLCRVAYFDKAQAGRVLRALAARGLVSVAPDASHGRRQIVDITPAGRALAEKVFPEALAKQLRLLRALSPEERRTTFVVLRKLLAAHGLSIPAPAATYKEKAD